MHTATPTIGNAAATWAGWAVSAVSAKFYRSQSDTARPRPPLTGKNLSKPASLGMSCRVISRCFHMMDATSSGSEFSVSFFQINFLFN